MRRWLILVAFVILGCGVSALAQDDYVIDPAADPPVFVQAPSCPTGTCFVYGSEVVGIHGNTVTFVNQGSSNNITGTFLAIVGVPNGQPAPGTGTASGVGITALTHVYQGNPGGAIYGWNGNFNGGTLSGSASTDVYKDVLKLNPPTSGNSESFGNWQAADKAALNLTVNSFTIYVYTVTNVNIGHGANDNTFSLTFSSNIPQGSFIVGYGCDSTVSVTMPNTPTQLYCGNTDSNGKKHISGGNTYATPFTHSALELDKPPVPEPGTLTLFGTGLFALAGLVRRKLQG